MKFISLGTIDIKILIPVFGAITSIIYGVFMPYSPKILILIQNPFLQNIYVTLGMILAFIPFLIIRYKSKAANKIYNNKKLTKSKLYKKLIVSKNIITKTRCKKFRFIFYSTIFDFLQTLSRVLFANYFIYNFWIFDIIFMSLFSFLILKTKYYKHQFISMIVIVILGLGLNIITYFQLDDTEDRFTLFGIFIQFISEICYCLGGIIWKYSMEKTYCDPYELCLFEGVFGFILYSICLVIFCRFELTVFGNKHPDNLIQYLNEFDYNDLIVCLVDIISDFIFNISIILTCNYFTPIHILITLIICDIYAYLQTVSNLALKILSIFILILIFIMLLIFIEIIEINIFNLSYYTKKNIDLRAKTDILIEFDSLCFLNDEPELDDESKKNNISMNSINNN